MNGARLTADAQEATGFVAELCETSQFSSGQLAHRLRGYVAQKAS